MMVLVLLAETLILGLDSTIIAGTVTDVRKTTIHYASSWVHASKSPESRWNSVPERSLALLPGSSSTSSQDSTGSHFFLDKF